MVVPLCRDSLLRLADFKRRLEQQDERARNEQKLKYDAIREKIHEQSSLINEPSQHRKGTAREVNEAVVEAWKREWQRNNERLVVCTYRVYITMYLNTTFFSILFHVLLL